VNKGPRFAQTDESGKIISSTEEKKDFDFLEHIPRIAPMLEWAN